MQINKIIQPSVDIQGDVRIKGDMYFHDNNTNTDFVSIDTNEPYIGIGSNVRYANYSNNYTTTTFSDLSRQNCVVSNNKYPVFISERISEVAPTRDADGNIAIDDIINKRLVLFANKTSLTARRKSNFYTINELKELATYYTETSIAGPNLGTALKYRYGPDINFEIMDKTLISRELGNIHMVIDNIEDNNGKDIIKAGFGVSVVDTTNTGSAIEREIMYINNNGVLHVDSINLGCINQDDKNISLKFSNNTLMINNNSLEKIINEQIENMFSVGNNGKLQILYKEKIYECVPV